MFGEGIPDALSQGTRHLAVRAPDLTRSFPRCNALSPCGAENALHLSKSHVRQGQNLG